MRASAAVILILLSLPRVVSIVVASVEGQHTTALWVRNGILLAVGLAGVVLLARARAHE